MTTSGSVAATVIDTSSIIEHAFRRVRIAPSAQTPETILIAKECLYMLLLNLGNRGLNLWAVEKVLLGLAKGQATYETDPGTLDVLNVVYSQPALVTATFSTIAFGGQADVPACNVMRVGFTVTAPFTGELLVNTSVDSAVFNTAVTIKSKSYVAGQYYWVDLPVVESISSVRVISAASPYPVIGDIQCATNSYDLPCTQWNRDTYAAINSKNQSGRPSTSYFFEKKLTPTLTLWPVPNNSTDHLTLYSHRQPQDVGSLTQQLEIPQRWLDGIIWLLASRLCFELPAVDTSLTQLIVQMADKQVFEAEQSESDGAPIYLTPGVGVYSR